MTPGDVSTKGRAGENSSPGNFLNIINGFKMLFELHTSPRLSSLGSRVEDRKGPRGVDERIGRRVVEGKTDENGVDDRNGRKVVMSSGREAVRKSYFLLLYRKSRLCWLYT